MVLLKVLNLVTAVYVPVHSRTKISMPHPSSTRPHSSCLRNLFDRGSKIGFIFIGVRKLCILFFKIWLENAVSFDQMASPSAPNICRALALRAKVGPAATCRAMSQLWSVNNEGSKIKIRLTARPVSYRWGILSCFHRWVVGPGVLSGIVLPPGWTL